MPGILVTRGSSLRVAAGGFIFPPDGSAPPPVQVELLLELWDRWLEISGDQTVAAEAAHRRALFTLRAQAVTLRAKAVHPPAQYQPPSYHDDLGAGVERRFVQFTAAKARAAFNSTSTLVPRLLGLPKPEHEELQEWIPSAQCLLAAALRGSADGSSA